MWPEIGDILPNYHLEDQTQPFPERGFRAAFEGNNTDSFWESLGVLSEREYDHFFQSKPSAVNTEQLNRQKILAAAFFCCQNKDSAGCWGPTWLCLKGFPVCSLLA